MTASAETRSLNIYHMHTGEHEVIVFKRDGVYDQQGLNALNHILRDWRRNETIRMDPALFDLIYEVYRDAGASGPIQIVCGYRAPETNNMLRARSRGVAKFSQHTLGKAMDFFLPGVALEKLREVGMKKQIGGVGFYPTSGSPFVHMDTGGVRAWPRMSRDQLVRLFPDGKTLHMPADGGPLPGYNQALAEYQQRHSGQQTQMADASASRSTGKGNVLAALFGMKTSEDDEEEATPAPAPASARAPVQPPVAVAAAAPQRPLAPLPAPQPARLAFAANLPHLAPKPADETATPLPAARPALQQVAMASPPAAGAIVPQGKSPPATRAPGAILPTGWIAGPVGTPAAAAPVQPAAALKQINVPIPTEKPQAVIGAVPRPRPAMATASLGTRPIDDAFSALTGTPRDPTSSALLGYAPVAAPLEPHATSVTRDQSSRLKLASLGTSDVAGSLPSVAAPTAARLSPAIPATLAKADRGDPMARLFSRITETVDARFLSAESSLRSALVARFIHPDQDSMPQMIVKPTQVLTATFDHRQAELATDHFTGPAVVALAVIELR